MTYPTARKRYQTFSSIVNPITNESKLWRYLTFGKFVWLMEYSSLYHARLDQMEDRFEGSVTRLYAQRRGAGEPVGYLAIPELEPINNQRLRICSFVNCWY